jgi:hypothetical protein
MSSNTLIKLIKTPTYEQDEFVTINADGSPKSFIYCKAWDYSSMQKNAVGTYTTVSFARISKKYRSDIQSLLAYISRKYKSLNKVNVTCSQAQH